MVGGQCLLAATAFHALVSTPKEPDHAAFHAFMQEHGRQYTHGSDEYHQRLAIFSRRAAEVEAQNVQPGRLWTAGVNKFSDRTDAELARLRGQGSGKGGQASGEVSSFLNQRAPPPEFGNRTALHAEQEIVDHGRGPGQTLPEELMKWTALRAAREVSNQGSNCGSCWAVASTKVLQLHREIYYPESPIAFSAQELLDCAPNPYKCGGSGGCEGATKAIALDWAMRHGLAREEEVPYRGVVGTCARSSAARLGGLSLHELTEPGVHRAPAGAGGLAFGMCGWEALPRNRNEALLRALVERGPVGVSVAASGPWNVYASGVFDGCPRDAVTSHMVVLLGYGRDHGSGAAFWEVQNSWGPDWGEGGRMRVLRHERSEEWCGTNRHPLTGTGCEGGPKEVTVCGMCGILYDAALPHFQCGAH